MPPARSHARVAGFVDALVGRPWAVAAVLGLLAFAITIVNLGGSPDTVYDEAVYTEAARNVARNADLTWRGDPVFIHPPLFFLAQGAWLGIGGAVDADFFAGAHSARVLVAVFAGANIALTFLLAHALAVGARPVRRLALAATAGILATFDPVLLRYSRVAMIDALALSAALLVLLAAWHLRDAPRRRYIPVVGLLIGVALLVKEVTIFLVIVPLVFGVLARRRDVVTRSAAALLGGVALWTTFPLWALSLGLFERFVNEKLRTFERLIGILQVSGWNRPNVSFVDALVLSAPQYLASYLVLLVGALVLVWLWLRGTRTAGTFLVAWLGSTYTFGAYTVGRGQLNEQFFVYLIPGAAIATVLAADAVTSSAMTALRRWTSWRRGALATMLLVAPIAGLVLLSMVSIATWGRFHATASDDGIERTVRLVDRELDACDVLNASGDVQKYVYGIRGRTVSNFASGDRALSRGVRYFFLNPKDVYARYGRMTPEFATWIQANGSLVGAFPSITYWEVQLWRVQAGPFDPIADIQPVAGGAFVNAHGSACGGYRVLDGPQGYFFTGYERLGGKPRIGRPASSPWLAGETYRQAFDTLVLEARGRAGLANPARPMAVVPLLAARRPDLFDEHDLPLPSEPASRGAELRALLTDAAIARAYLGTEPADATGEEWRIAADRWGVPLGPPAAMRDGVIRQPFERVIWERDPRPGATPGLALLGPLALETGLVPGFAGQPRPVPNVAEPEEADLASSVTPFLVLAGGALLAWVIGTLLVNAPAGATLVRPVRRPGLGVGVGVRAPLAGRDRPLRVMIDGRVVQDRYHGIGRVTLALARALAEHDDLELTVLRPAAPASRLSVDTLEGLPRVRIVPFGAPVASWREQVAWPGLLRRERPDVLLLPYHLATPLRTALPTVAVVHDCIFEASPTFAPGPALRLAYRLLTRVVLRRATAVVTISEATRSALMSHYGLRLPAGHVVRNAVDRAFFDRVPAKQVARVRRRYRLNARYLLAVGVRRPHKNHVTLVDAFAVVAWHEPDVHLVIVGGGDRRFPDPVPARVTELGLRDRVHLLEGVPEADLAALYQGATAFAFPSLVEGFGLPVVEAMASGTPVVASDVPAVSEAAGGAAVLVPPLDTEAWGDALRRILCDPQLSARMGRRGPVIARRHTWGDAGDRMRRVLVDTARGVLSEETTA